MSDHTDTQREILPLLPEASIIHPAPVDSTEDANIIASEQGPEPAEAAFRPEPVSPAPDPTQPALSAEEVTQLAGGERDVIVDSD